MPPVDGKALIQSYPAAYWHPCIPTRGPQIRLRMVPAYTVLQVVDLILDTLQLIGAVS